MRGGGEEEKVTAKWMS